MDDPRHDPRHHTRLLTKYLTVLFDLYVFRCGIADSDSFINYGWGALSRALEQRVDEMGPNSPGFTPEELEAMVRRIAMTWAAGELAEGASRPAGGSEVVH